VILEVVRRAEGHPTADEVYDAVRKILPRISMGTVYRNLEILSACGEALKLDLGEGKKRFDARMEPHYHLRCTECGRVIDVPYVPLEQDVGERFKDIGKFKITNVQIHFDGICGDCLKKMN